MPALDEIKTNPNILTKQNANDPLASELVTTSQRSNVSGLGKLSQLGQFQNWQEARKVRLQHQNNVSKLHNRIALLEKEEEKANKRIEDARKQAMKMI